MKLSMQQWLQLWKINLSLNLEDLKNYRPVRNTPIFAKIIGKIPLDQLNAYLTTAKPYNETQLGYQKTMRPVFV